MKTRPNEKIMNPTYTIKLNKLEQNYKNFVKFGEVYFPVKTNSNQYILNKLIKLGSSFECDSISHIKKIYRKKNAHKIIFSNVAKAYEDIVWAIKHKLSFYTVDDEKTLRNIIILAKQNRFKFLDINVRINVFDIFRKEFEEKGTQDSRLGASVNTCKKLLDLINNEQDIQINKGISFYVQAEVHDNDDILKRATKYIANNFSKEDKIQWVNIGGGCTVDRIKNSKKEMYENLKLIGVDKIILEPGRYMVGDVEDLTIPVKRIIETDLNGGETVASLGIGIYNGLLDTKLHHRKFKYYIESGDKHEELKEWDKVSKKLVFRGPTADSSDLLGTFNMPKISIAENFVVKILNIGAYVEVLYSDFSGKLTIDYKIQE